MAYEIRVLRYAREHVAKAESMLIELSSINRALHETAEKMARLYRNATIHGMDFIPIQLMTADNDFKFQQLRYEELQSKIVLNLSLSFSFCSELIEQILKRQEMNVYSLDVRIVIDSIIRVATDESMKRANLSSFASNVARTEAMILLKDNEKLGLIKRKLLKFRNEIS